jgi:hypothetical protein
MLMKIVTIVFSKRFFLLIFDFLKNLRGLCLKKIIFKCTVMLEERAAREKREKAAALNGKVDEEEDDEPKLERMKNSVVSAFFRFFFCFSSLIMFVMIIVLVPTPVSGEQARIDGDNLTDDQRTCYIVAFCSHLNTFCCNRGSCESIGCA